MFEVRHYITDDGHDIFASWHEALKDMRAKIAVERRIQRVELGNFGDCKPCREGVWELRIDVGAGWRVYYARTGKTVVLLLCGGDKHSQDADIARACEYWKHWQHRNQDKEWER